MGPQCCPLCRRPVELSPRYPRCVCADCASRASSLDGWLLPTPVLPEALRPATPTRASHTKGRIVLSTEFDAVLERPGLAASS